MDLLNENRSLIHTGKLLRQPDTGFEWNSWTELFVLLFDNYCKNLVSHHLTLSANTSCSGDDQAKREGWYHQIPCVQKGKLDYKDSTAI